MKKSFQIILLIITVIFSISGCKQAKNIDKETDINIAKPQIEINEYTTDDESSLTNGSRVVKYDELVVYLGSYTSKVYINNLKTGSTVKISEDTPESLWFDGNWIYYSLKGGKRGIYRLKIDGTTEKISEDYTLQISLLGNEMYYTRQIGHDPINWTPQGELYRMNTDGTNKMKVLSNNIKNYFKIYKGWIYYTRLDDRSLNKAKLDGSQATLLAKGRTYIHFVTDNNIYYRDYKNGETLHRLNLNDGENELLGHFGRIAMCNDNIYVQTRLPISGKAIEDNFSLYLIDDKNNETTKLLTLLNIGIDTFFTVKNDWVYLNCNEGAYRISLNDPSCAKEIISPSDICSVYGDYGYYFEPFNSSGKDPEIKRVEL